jgi:hypothetical protein
VNKRTPEERLLAKRRLGAYYLDDVRTLIAQRDRLYNAVRGLLELDGYRPRDGSVNVEWEAQVLAEARAALEVKDSHG